MGITKKLCLLLLCLLASNTAHAQTDTYDNYYLVSEAMNSDILRNSLAEHMWNNNISEYVEFASSAEKADADSAISPFDDLNSKRLIIGYSRNDAGGSFGGNTRRDKKADHVVTAIKFPAERMMRIKGNQITHIRFSLWHTRVTEFKVWIGSSREMRDLACLDITNLQTGWNDITLDQPYTITGDSIVVGVEFYLEYNDFIPVKWAPYDGEEDGALLLFKSDYYGNASWETHNGSYYIQCLVEGDSIPEYDIHITRIVVAGSHKYAWPIKAGETTRYVVWFRNWGSKLIAQKHSIEMQCLLDGEDTECANDSYEAYYNDPRLQSICYYVTPNNNVKIGKHQITLFPKSINGEDVQYHETPKLAELRIYEHDMGRQKIHIQNYTGNWCGYCPEFDSLIEQKRKERDDLVLISVPFNQTVSEAEEAYQSILYGDGIPDVDLNRCSMQYNKNVRTTIIEHFLDRAKAQPAFANVNISGSYDTQGHTMSIVVSGERNEDFLPLEEWTNLTVLLVEDKVLGGQFGSDLSPYYPHNGVIRKNVSAIWGDLVEWNGDHYEMYYTATLDNTWNPRHLRVVAFLGKPFTGDNYDDIIVVNCNEIPVINDLADVNNDGAVNIADVNAVINMILSESVSSAGDANDDGTVNIADINAIINKILSQ